MSYQLTVTDLGRVDTSPSAPLVTDLLTLAETLNYLRQDYGSLTVEDTLVKDMIQSARRWIEQYIGQAVISKSIVAYTEDEMDFFTLPMGPVDDVTKVSRITYDGTATELTLNTDYYLTGLTNKTVSTYPTWSTLGASTAGLKVEYTAAMTEVPATIKEACLALTAHLYFHRGDNEPVPPAIYEKLNPFRKL